MIVNNDLRTSEELTRQTAGEIEELRQALNDPFLLPESVAALEERLKERGLAFSLYQDSIHMAHLCGASLGEERIGIHICISRETGISVQAVVNDACQAKREDPAS